MKCMLIYLIVCVPLLLYATPDPFMNKVETIIGQVGDNYCVVEYTNSNKGSHSEYEEEFYLLLKSSKTNVEVSRTLIKRQSVALDDGIRRVIVLKKGSDIVLKSTQYQPIALAFPFWDSLTIENNQIIIKDGFRDDPTKYEIKLKFSEKLVKSGRIDYMGLMESEIAYYFILRVHRNDFIEETTIFSILKREYIEMIPKI